MPAVLGGRVCRCGLGGGGSGLGGGLAVARRVTRWLLGAFFISLYADTAISCNIAAAVLTPSPAAACRRAPAPITPSRNQSTIHQLTSRAILLRRVENHSTARSARTPSLGGTAAVSLRENCYPLSASVLAGLAVSRRGSQESPEDSDTLHTSARGRSIMACLTEEVAAVLQQTGDVLSSLVEGSHGSASQNTDLALPSLFRAFQGIRERAAEDQCTLAVLALAKSGLAAPSGGQPARPPPASPPRSPSPPLMVLPLFPVRLQANRP